MLFVCHFEPGQCSKSSRTYDLQGHGVRSWFLCAVRVQTACAHYRILE